MAPKPLIMLKENTHPAELVLFRLWLVTAAGSRFDFGCCYTNYDGIFFPVRGSFCSFSPIKKNAFRVFMQDPIKYLTVNSVYHVFRSFDIVNIISDLF